MTARALITAALRSLRVLGRGDTLDASEAADALSRLNDWIDALKLERLTIPFVLRTTEDLVSGTASYTIGSGGDIDIVRPMAIEHAGLIIDTSASPVTEIGIKVFTDQEWQAIQQKDLQNALVHGIFFDHGWTTSRGRIYPWPVPNVGTLRLVLYTPQALAEFATLDTDYVFEQGYRRFVRTNLVVELAPEYGKQVTAAQAAAARDSKAWVKRSNVRPVEARVDPALTPHGQGAWNYRTGGYR